MRTKIGEAAFEVVFDFETLERQKRQELPKKAEEAGRAGGEAFGGSFVGSVKRTLGDLGRVVKDTVGAPLRGLDSLIHAVVIVGMNKIQIAGIAAARGLRAVAEGTRDANGELSAMGKAANAAATGLEKVVGATIAVGEAVLRAKVTLVAMAAAVVGAGVAMETRFRPSWQRVLTLIPDGVEGLGDLKNSVTGMSAALGVDAPDAANAFYNVLSAMPHLVREPTRALDVLNAALRVASTGFATSEEAAAAITATLNAFSLDASEAERVANSLFATQDAGVTTFGEIAREIGRVGDLTANLGGEFEELLAVMAPVTTAGVATNQVMTQLRAILVSIINASPTARAEAQALGIDLSAAGLRAKGLVGFLEDLVEKTGGDIDVISRFITTQEGLTLLASLSGRMGEVRQVLDEIEASGGRLDGKVGEMNDSLSRQRKIFTDLIQEQLRLIGAPIEGTFTSWARVVNDFTREVVELTRRLRIMEGLRFSGRGLLNERLDRRIQAMQTIADLEGQARQQEIQRQDFLREQERLRASGLPIVGLGDERPDEGPYVLDAGGRLIHIDRVLTPNELRDRMVPAPATERTMGIDVADIGFDEEGRMILAPGQRPTPGVSTPLAPERPAAPETPEFLAEEIEELRNLGRLRAELHFLRTQDEEAYQAMLEETRQLANAAVLDAVERMREAGFTEEELLPLQGLLRMPDEDDATRELERLRDRAVQLREQVDTQLLGLTTSLVDDTEAALTRLAEEIEETYAALGEEVPEALREAMQKLEDDVENIRLVEKLDEQIRELEERAQIAGAELPTAGIPGLVGTGGVPVAESREEVIADLDALIAVIREEMDAVDAETRAYERLEARLKRIIQLRRQERGEVAAQRREKEKNEQETDEERERREAEEAREKELRDLKEKARDIEQITRAALQLADAFGIVSDETRAVLESLVQIGANIPAALKGDPASIGGVIGGTAQLISSIAGGGEEREARRRQIEAMADLERALRDLEDAILSDISAQEQERILAVAESIDLGSLFDTAVRNLTPAQLNAVRELEERTGIDILNEEGTHIIDSRLRLAIERFRELMVGLFPPTVEGQLDAFQFEVGVLGDAAGDSAAQLRTLTDRMSGFAPAFTDEIERLMAEGGPEAVDAFLDDIARRLAARDESLFDEGGIFEDLSPEAARDLLDTFNRLAEGAAGGGAGTESAGFQVSRTITETSAGFLISLATTRNVLLEQIRDATLGRPVDVGVQRGGFQPPPPEGFPLPELPGGGTTITLTVEGPNVNIQADSVDQAVLEGAGEIAAHRTRDLVDRQLREALTDHRRAQGA